MLKAEQQERCILAVKCICFYNSC